MNIVFIHYHLKPGGVTRVIQQQAQICRARGWNYCILAGENPLAMEDVVVIPELHYDLHRSALGSPGGVEGLAERILSCSSDYLEATPDILHVHNATLAKNSDLLPALNILSSRGIGQFLQLHDFAEDGRPGVYSSAEYPPAVHYGFINSRDGSFLASAGVPKKQLHSLPNLVSPLPAAGMSVQAEGKATTEDRKFALYPVRGIRRKNIGEVVLLSLLLDGVDIGITLPPNNPADLPSYNFWKECASTLQAPVYFEYAAENGFEQSLKRADFFISTSVQEGFGFAFLEPWTINKPVCGRKIPYVHRDFVAEGIEMPWFYDELLIPVSAIDMASFKENWLEQAHKSTSRFRIALRNQGLNQGARKTMEMESELEGIFAAEFEGADSIDFAKLDRRNQAGVVKLCAENSELRNSVHALNPILGRPPFNGSNADCRDVTHKNKNMVAEVYGEERYGQRLESIYKSVLGGSATSPGTIIDKEDLLFNFLHPANMFLVAGD